MCVCARAHSHTHTHTHTLPLSQSYRNSTSSTKAVLPCAFPLSLSLSLSLPLSLSLFLSLSLSLSLLSLSLHCPHLVSFFLSFTSSFFSLFCAVSVTSHANNCSVQFSPCNSPSNILTCNWYGLDSKLSNQTCYHSDDFQRLNISKDRSGGWKYSPNAFDCNSLSLTWSKIDPFTLLHKRIVCICQHNTSASMAERHFVCGFQFWLSQGMPQRLVYSISLPPHESSHIPTNVANMLSFLDVHWSSCSLYRLQTHLYYANPDRLRCHRGIL